MQSMPKRPPRATGTGLVSSQRMNAHTLSPSASTCTDAGGPISRPPGNRAPPRHVMQSLASGVGIALLPRPAPAQATSTPFPQWIDAFRARALARGVSEATYGRVMGGLKPDLDVFKQIKSQPEFNEKVWQYLNR